MITVNGENRTLEHPVSVTEYLKACNYIPVQVVVELNEEIIKRGKLRYNCTERWRCCREFCILWAAEASKLHDMRIAGIIIYE